MPNDRPYDDYDKWFQSQRPGQDPEKTGGKETSVSSHKFLKIILLKQNIAANTHWMKWDGTPGEGRHLRMTSISTQRHGLGKQLWIISVRINQIP